MEDKGTLSTGQALGGPIGILIAGNIIDQNSKDFVQILNDKKISFGSSLSSVIVQKFRTSVFEVYYLHDETAKLKSDGKTVNYDHIQTDADAILNVWFGVIGYIALPFSDYQPSVYVGAELLDAHTKERLYYRIFHVGRSYVAKNIVKIDPDIKYKFSSFDTLNA